MPWTLDKIQVSQRRSCDIKNNSILWRPHFLPEYRKFSIPQILQAHKSGLEKLKIQAKNTSRILFKTVHFL